MKKPKPIKFRTTGLEIQIRLVGPNNRDSCPYIMVDTGRGTFGYIENRDIKRLARWCEVILNPTNKQNRK